MQDFKTAVQFAIDHEVKWSRDPITEPDLYGVHHNDPKPWNTLLGPAYPRGAVSGVIYLQGKLVCTFGEPDKADQTFSVAKSYLALLVGKALELGLIPSLDTRVTTCVPGIGFDDPHNSQITWRHLLNQTSEWAGTCFGIPDQVERFRRVVLDPKPVLGKKGDPRELQKPGTFWEYNDVRINQLSLALLYIFGSNLSQVFKHHFLEPLGCGKDFTWEGYENSWVELKDPKTGDSKKIQSVPGGTHWGGGVRISALDQALIGQLLLNDGTYESGGQQKKLLSSAFIKEIQTPCPVAPFYGMLTWLNPNRKTFTGASSNAYFMFGAGGNYVWIDPDLSCVVVTRWIDPDFYPKFTELVETSIKRS